MSEVKEFCAKYSACSDGAQWASKYKTLAEVFDDCESGEWMIWMLRQENRLDKPTSAKLAIAFAERVLRIYEDKYPDDKSPRQAIEATKAWLENPCEETEKAARAAADAAEATAYAAADAVADAAYAVYAADAAEAAADAAAVVADTAYAAYAAAHAADAAADVAERKAQADIIRSMVSNPWKKEVSGE